MITHTLNGYGIEKKKLISIQLLTIPIMAYTVSSDLYIATAVKNVRYFIVHKIDS